MSKSISFQKTLYVENHPNLFIELQIYELGNFDESGTIEFRRRITIWDKETRKDLLEVTTESIEIFPDDLKAFDFNKAMADLEKLAIKAVQLFEVKL